MSPVEFKKRLCRPVEFKGERPHNRRLREMRNSYRHDAGDLELNTSEEDG